MKKAKKAQKTNVRKANWSSWENNTDTGTTSLGK